MFEIFHTLIYQPLYNILIFLYNIVPGADFGISIILITLILRLALMPIYKKQIESQQKLQEMQPKIKELQNKYKDDKERQTKELMQFYKDNKTNPFSGCLPLIIQLIFLIGIYRILITISENGLVVDPKELYSFVSNPGNINQMFIGFFDLTKASPLFAILAAIAQYFQTKMLMQKQPAKTTTPSENGMPDISQIMGKQMLYLGPLLTLFIGIKFPAGLSLYWLASTLFMLIQQIYMEKGKKKQGAELLKVN
jgi:YidC/Oxa1 family membrane protein insertase